MTGSLAESLGGGSPDGWALDFLATANLPATPSNVQAVVSWEYAESGGGGGMWNPLNTTQSGYPGETDFNSVGVKNYASRADGVWANARVLHNGYYPGVLAAFVQGDNAQAVVDAIISSPWGTKVIPLVGTVTPSPAPQPSPQEVDVQNIALPGPGTPSGRIPLAVWGSDHPNRIALENGARLKGDEATPIANVRVWTPRRPDGTSQIPAGVTGTGIAGRYSAGQLVEVVLCATGGNTYLAEIP